MRRPILYTNPKQVIQDILDVYGEEYFKRYVEKALEKRYGGIYRVDKQMNTWDLIDINMQNIEAGL